MKKAALHNLGCKVNAYETEAMGQLLRENGYEIVPFTEKADVYVINTCSVTGMADKKSRQMIHRARKLNPDAIVVAAGCYVQTAGEQVLADEAIDILLGNNKKHELAEALKAFAERRSQAEKQADRAGAAENQVDAAHSTGKWTDIADIGQESSYEELSLDRTAEHTRAFLKVQDGCNQFCSYCIIPYARGRVRSRGLSEVVAEVERLAENGYREVVLTGIHLSSYGTDNGESLLSLIQRVHAVEGIRRIRLGSLEPKIVTEEFARELSRLPKVCPHFHLSLQSGCDATLKRMNRKYTCEEYRRGCALLRKYFAHPALTTDVIAGFPGETEEEFEMTRAFLREIAFFEVHIFKYSKRRGTRAASMPDQVSEEVKNARSDILFEDTGKLSRDFAAWYTGKKVEILLEEEAVVEGRTCIVGHTPEYVKAALPRGKYGPNQMVLARAETVLSDHSLLLDQNSTENID